MQQCLLLAVCDEGCEAAEEQSDDEARTSIVPDQREGKTEVIKQQYLPLAVLKRENSIGVFYVSLYASCNSTYRLRYATKGTRQQRSEETMRTAHL